ncbi:hypothetical protein [Rhizobacter sp. Root1221]|nr:hypothetical protein [Rhizobacter sp. Root1221]
MASSEPKIVIDCAITAPFDIASNVAISLNSRFMSSPVSWA